MPVFQDRSSNKMPAKLILRDQVFEVRDGMTIRHAIQKCGLNLQSVLATRDGELVSEEEFLKEGDVIKLVAVISGG
jgi:sulfur carrier protein ThiS